MSALLGGSGSKIPKGAADCPRICQASIGAVTLLHLSFALPPRSQRQDRPGASVALRLLRVGSRKQGLSHRLGKTDPFDPARISFGEEPKAPEVTFARLAYRASAGGTEGGASRRVSVRRKRIAETRSTPAALAGGCLDAGEAAGEDPRRTETVSEASLAQWLRSTSHSRYHRGRGSRSRRGASVALPLLRIGSRKQGLSHRLGNAGFSGAPQRPSFNAEAALFYLFLGVRAAPYSMSLWIRLALRHVIGRRRRKQPSIPLILTVRGLSVQRARCRHLQRPAKLRRRDLDHFLAASLSGGSPRPGSHFPVQDADCEATSVVARDSSQDLPGTRRDGTLGPRPQPPATAGAPGLDTVSPWGDRSVPELGGDLKPVVLTSTPWLRARLRGWG
nr:uncharacterized protein LOC129490689 [Symphalangus syndactylus]